MKINNFEISLRDRDDLEYLILEIRYFDIVLCEINREKGVNDLEVNILCNDVLYNNEVIKFTLDDFLSCLNFVKNNKKDIWC